MKKWIAVILGILTCLILVILGGGYFWFQRTLEKSLPQISGELTVRGLKDRVEIIRDTYGVPHIYARNEPDLFVAMGYAMAQDRLWQMEFYRRLGSGRLSELFGESFLKADRYFRMLTPGGLKDEVPSELAFMTKGLAAGANAFLETHQDRLPLECKLLRHKPEPWKPDDYLAILKVINWSLSVGWTADLTAAKILEKAGEEKFRAAFPVWPEGAPLIIPAETRGLAGFSDPNLRVASQLKERYALSPSAASNNWVLSGKKSATGQPILANDPHLPLSNPSFWWEVHLACPTLNVSGYAIPGVPGVPIGHNDHVAWGITNVMVDDVDFYEEKINPGNPRQYLYKDHWEDMKVIEETIRIKGKDPVKTEILLTRNGPIVNEIKGNAKEKVFSARWAFNDGMQPGKAAYGLAKAENIQDVREALQYWELPCQNFVFADTQGNIGYWCCATIPIRSKGDGLLPVPGWTGEYDWIGYVPFDQKPHLINPEEGFIATANNKVADEGYPYLIGHYWEPSDRITRIRQLLGAKEKYSVQDIKKMQNDVYCVLASEMTPKMIHVLERRLTGEEAKKAGDILAGWDFMMDKESVGACLYEVTFRKMMTHTFKDELGEELFQAYLKIRPFPPRAIRMMIREGASPWLDDVTTPRTETLEDILAKSLSDALSELKASIGADMNEWTWGTLHQHTFGHALGKKKPLDRIFNLGPFPVGGNNLTVNKKQYYYSDPFHAVHGVSERMIVDFTDMHRALHVLPTGESGHLKSPHHRDQLGLYLGGQYHTAWMKRGDVERHSEGTLRLIPE